MLGKLGRDTLGICFMLQRATKVQTASLERGNPPLRGRKEAVIAEFLRRTAGRGGALPGILFKFVNCSRGIGMDINEGTEYFIGRCSFKESLACCSL